MLKNQRFSSSLIVKSQNNNSKKTQYLDIFVTSLHNTVHPLLAETTMQPKKQTIFKLLLLFSLLMSHNAVFAQQWYQVEVIVFEQLRSATDEQWPVMTSIPVVSLKPDMNTKLIQSADTSELTTTVQRLRQSSNYRVHYYQAWQQPILTKSQAKSVAIKSNDGLIDGYLRLYKGTYLYSTVDLWLKENRTPMNDWSDNISATSTRDIRNPHLVETRRVRSNKLHFYDHPKIGMLLQLTTIDTPAAIAQQSSASFSLPAEAEATSAE